MYYAVQIDWITTDSPTDQGKEPQSLKRCLIRDVTKLYYKPHRVGGGYLCCIFKMPVNKGFVQGEENAGG